MELHQLRYFVAVAQAGSFSRAAERCHVSQPSLSQQIQKLERWFRQPLFHRLSRRVVLTDVGRTLLDRAVSILSAVDDAERLLRSGEGGGSGRLAIGAIPTVAPYLLPPALGAFARRHPGAELVVREDVTAHLLQAIAEGELDLALVALPVADPRLSVQPVVVEPLLLATPRKHPLARRRRVTVHDLAGERFILLGEMHCLAEQVLTFCRAQECQPLVACTGAQISTIQELIALGQGVSLLPELARRADATGRVAYRPLSDDAPRRTIAAVWHKSRFRGPLAHDFVSELCHWAKKESLAAKGTPNGP